MNRTEIATVLETLQLDIELIEAADVKASVVVLLNLVETLVSENDKLKEDQQQLKDEINRWKGEQGQPAIKGQTRKRDDLSSEPERKEASGAPGTRGQGEHQRESKRDRIKIDRVQECPVNRDELPADAIFKGYERVLVQDLKMISDHVEYRRAVYDSPSQQKTYRGALPEEVKGQFGAGMRSLMPAMKPVGNRSEPKILAFLQNFNVRLSAGYISRWLTDPPAVFHHEKDALYRTALEGGAYQQIDDTRARVNGENHSTQVVCNPWYTASFTTDRKDRLSVLDVLRKVAPRRFLFHSETLGLLEQCGLSRKLIARVESLEKDQPLTEEQITELLEELQPGPRQRHRLLEAAAIAAYHQETELPVVKLLLCDDAAQFKLLTEELARCWVPDGRHDKKRNPIVPGHREHWERFRQDYGAFYGQLLAFKQTPTPTEANRLSEEFDRLFATRTEYAELADRIAKTLAKKEALLAVLRHPKLPLHNHDAELGARAQARVRDVSLHTTSKAGTQAKDTFMTLVQTAKKLGVSADDYLHDRVSGKVELPSLAQLIREKSKAELLPCPDPP
jgi:cell division protein FtsB